MCNGINRTALGINARYGSHASKNVEMMNRVYSLATNSSYKITLQWRLSELRNDERKNAK